MEKDEKLGKLAKDKVTGFEGIIIGKIEYLFGCNQYGLASQKYNEDKKERTPTEWFDEGRIIILGAGITAEEVAAPSGNGGELNRDTPGN